MQYSSASFTQSSVVYCITVASGCVENLCGTSEVKTLIMKQTSHIASLAAKTKSNPKYITNSEKYFSRLKDKSQDSSVFHGVLFNWEGSADLSFLLYKSHTGSISAPADEK